MLCCVHTEEKDSAEKNAFYDKLRNILSSKSEHDLEIAMGIFKAKVLKNESNRSTEINGWENIQNDNGQWVIHWYVLRK